MTIHAINHNYHSLDRGSPRKTTVNYICEKFRLDASTPKSALQDLCVFVDKHNSMPIRRLHQQRSAPLSDTPQSRRLNDPSWSEINRIFRSGDSNLNTLFNGNILIGKNTNSEEEYKLFTEFVTKMLTYLYDNTPEFRAAIDGMNATARERMPGKPKVSGIIYNIDASSRSAAGSISAWKGRKGSGYRESVRTDSAPAEGAPFYMFLSLTKGLVLNSDQDIETIFHEFSHALQFASGNAAPFTDIYVRLGSRKSTGEYVNEFETTGSLKGPSPYSEISFLCSFEDREILAEPTYGGHTPQDLISEWQEADLASYLNYANSTMPHGIIDFDTVSHGAGPGICGGVRPSKFSRKGLVGSTAAASIVVGLSILGLIYRRFSSVDHRPTVSDQTDTTPKKAQEVEV